MNNVSRIYLDCSHTYVFGGNTGIQRVVRNLVRHAPHVENTSLHIIPVVYVWGSYRHISSIPLRDDFLVILLRKAKRFYTTITRSFKQTRSEGQRTGEQTRDTFAARVRAVDIAYRLASVRHIFKKRVALRRGDVLMVVDNFWTSSALARISTAHKNGIRIAVLIYDLIPLSKPEAFDPGLSEVFGTQVRKLLSMASFGAAISTTTKKEVERFIERFLPGKRLPIEVLILGADPDMYSRSGQKAVRKEVRDLFGSRRTSNAYIVVSTIEPRKNHTYILDTFEEIWSKDLSPALCIIGKIGWNCEEIAVRLHSHPELGKRLFVFHDLSDEELLYAYQQAKALITASKEEGFGLPIVEALRRFCPVFASDIPVHREVGGDFCTYFELGDRDSLASQIKTYEKTGMLGRKKDEREFTWPTWRESVTDLMDKLGKYVNGETPAG